MWPNLAWNTSGCVLNNFVVEGPLVKKINILNFGSTVNHTE